MSKTWYEQGGAAFPTNTTNEQNSGACEADYGMSLRDWFAGQALPAVIETCRSDMIHAGGFAEHFSTRAYAIADAMLKARQP